MCILTSAMRADFISSLRPSYARHLSTKLIKNRNEIMFGAKNLYLFGTPFANRGAGRQPRIESETDVESALAPLVDKIWAYFNMNPAPSKQADFDLFHKELCNLFLSGCSTYGYSHTYGNAQKEINVLFKYLACYSDAPRFADWFKYCHMALDRYTYNGYRLPFYREVIHPAIHGCPAGILPAWSKLSELDYTNIISDIVSYVSANPKTYNEYLDICTAFPILTHIPRLLPKDDYVLTPFEAEFFLWSIAKNCMDKDSSNRYIYSPAFVELIKIRL